MSGYVGAILAGGRGSRMGSLGEGYPKALLPLANEPLMAHHLRLFAELGIRKAFVLKLKPGALDDYIYWHDNIWPELQQEIARQGIAEISLFQLEDMIFLDSRVNDPEAWTRLWDSDVHRRWGELMNPLMHYRDDGIIDSRELREIWHFTPELTG